MTVTEREALVTRARAQAIDLRACNALPRHHRDTQDEIDAAASVLDEAADRIEQLEANHNRRFEELKREAESVASPAVTVTEEMAGPRNVAEWTPWNGGGCPVDAKALMHLITRGGKEIVREASRMNWYHAKTGTDAQLCTGTVHLDPECDIIMYRALESTSPRKSERDAVLEEAAQIAESERNRHKPSSTDRWDEGYTTASWHIANSIRALKSASPADMGGGK